MDNTNSSGLKKVISDLWQYKVKDEEPIIVVGPAEDNSKKSLDKEGCKRALLRIYSYGGKLGGIVLDENNEEDLLIGADYLENHLLQKDNLSEYSTSEMEQIDKWKADIAKRRADSKSEKGLSGNQITLKGNRDTIYYGDSIKLAVRATWLWGQKDSEQESKERNEQTRVIKYHIGPLASYTGKYVPTDMEYKLPIPQTGCIKNSIHLAKLKGKNGVDNGDYRHNRKKPDFIVFDGQSFGLVEMKYNGASMERSQANSLREHFLDFISIIAPPDSLLRDDKLTGEDGKKIWHVYNELSDEQRRKAVYKAQWEVLHECLYRALCMKEIGLLSEECALKLDELIQWYNKQDTDGPFPYEKNLLWCGFYFMNGPVVPGKKSAGSKEKIEKEVRAQLDDLIKYNYSKNNPSPVSVKYDFCEYDNIGFDFSTEITSVITVEQ